jgi:hypothetical protein
LFDSIIAKTLDSFRKLAPVPLLAIGIASTVMLFAPLKFVSKLGVETFREEYRSVIGGVFIVSWCYLLAHLIWWLLRKIAAKIKFRRTRKIREGYLHDLTPEEKDHLTPYILGDKTTQLFHYDDGVAIGLIHKEIVYQASTKRTVCFSSQHSTMGSKIFETASRVTIAL